MPRRIAEQLRQLVLKRQRLAADCTDKKVANELERVSAEIADKAQTLDDLFKHIEEAS